MTIQILETARRDLIKGYHFYERQSPGLGDYYLDYHCMLSKRFPFAIYYTIDSEIIFIEAILDCRQNPERAGERFI